MTREKTVEISEKIKNYLGSSIPALDRLVYLDETIWKLSMINNGEVKYSQEFIYKKKQLFGFSKSVGQEFRFDIDDKVANKIVRIFEEEYQQQVEICETLIKKLEVRV